MDISDGPFILKYLVIHKSSPWETHDPVAARDMDRWEGHWMQSHRVLQKKKHARSLRNNRAAG